MIVDSIKVDGLMISKLCEEENPRYMSKLINCL